jgi:hypothetical protein
MSAAGVSPRVSIYDLATPRETDKTHRRVTDLVHPRVDALVTARHPLPPMSFLKRWWRQAVLVLVMLAIIQVLAWLTRTRAP